ncbi:hypothetical protein GDO78_018234 [Eleutherodactylus coqui]|uniref:Uncharacterized protein n=1 Tax=Eleutherodactylus coqui TaxID=57060 RepID=A0A8J6E9R0_ELECQ|nr:hypothetical protein GDO78_018234 [Eleutherodactylus coqui]
MPRLSFITGGKKKLKQMIRTGTLRKPRRMQSQDYQTILETCLRSKKLFVDETFPAEISSIGCGDLLRKLPSCVEWKRPQELVKNPQLIAENASRFDLHQGLTDLQIGQVSEALVDFTGGVNMTIRLRQAPPDLWQIMLRAAYSGCLMGCQTRSGQLSVKERLLLHKTREDGEFWMSIEDFEAQFIELVICKLTPDLMSHENGKEWTLSMQIGKWISGSTAGGRINYTESYWKNPQYRLKILLGDNMEKYANTCNVLVSLLQKQNHKHRNKSPPLYIGISIFMDDLQNFIIKYFEKHQEINVSELQILLNKGSWSSARLAPVKFSLDACKVIMAQLDVRSSGTLNMIEFYSLWQRLLSFQEIFQSKDIDKSGHLKLNDLQAAVQEKGITLGRQFYTLMARRYGNSSLKINFENFVCLMLRMEINGVQSKRVYLP